MSAAFGQAASLLQRVLPACDAVAAAIGRQTGVIEDDARVGEIARKPRGFVKLCPRRLQIEAQAALHELREARAPARVIHLPGARLVPDAAYEIELRQPRQRRAEVVAVQPGLRDRDGGKTALAPQPLDVAHLADRVARVPFGFHVDRFHHLVRSRIGEVVGRKIGPPQRGVVAVAKRDRRLVAKPRVVIDARIPEMLVRIDDREFHEAQS